MPTPSDPLYPNQWHFGLIGNIEAIWNDYDGTGVNVGVYDSGVDYNHEDLAANYDSSLHVVDNLGNAVNPFPIAADDGHGTACAGIIAAANNGVGGVGVAYGVTLTGVNVDFDNVGLYGSINAFDYAPFVDIVKQAADNFDIMSNSWGSFPDFFSDNGLLGGGFATAVNKAYDYLVDQGRDGLGTIIVQAAGNDDLDANGSGLNSSRFTITVAATEANGFAAWYSNYGASILVAAPAASVTTDITGGAGYDPGSYTDTFNGTSAATPVVSGVVALMLDANEGLGWRDVQNILAASATLTGSAFNDPTPDVEEDGSWYANAGNNWNGGGNHVSTNYGYGMVNAFNAVRMAEVWSLFGAAQTSSNEKVVTSGLNNFPDTVVPTNGTAFSTTFKIDTDVVVEHVSLRLNFATAYVGDLRIVLTSADGTRVVVAAEDVLLDSDADGNWVFGIDSLRGELSSGTWKMKVFDTNSFDPITVRSAKLDVYGSTPTANDVYHFTDEFSIMAGFDSTRRTISDTDGGIDWLNLAAVTGNVVLNMASGQGFAINGVVAKLSGLFEKAVTGDGNDRLTGNSANNELRGMRGNDWLNGAGGSDKLIGGWGNDIYITDGGDTITERAGQGTDTVRSSVNLTLGANLENLVLTGTSAINGTGNSLNNDLTGNNGNNILNGGLGNDRLVGGSGNDTLIGDAGNDILTGGSGADSFVFRTALGASNIDEITDFNAAADTIRLENAIFAGLAAGTLAASAFASNLSGDAADASDRIIYESDTGYLYFDSDGNGAGAKVHFATLTAGLSLTNADFFVF